MFSSYFFYVGHTVHTWTSWIMPLKCIMLKGVVTAAAEPVVGVMSVLETVAGLSA